MFYKFIKKILIFLIIKTQILPYLAGALSC